MRNVLLVITMDGDVDGRHPRRSTVRHGQQLGPHRVHPPGRRHRPPDRAGGHQGQALEGPAETEGRKCRLSRLRRGALRTRCRREIVDRHFGRSGSPTIGAIIRLSETRGDPQSRYSASNGRSLVVRRRRPFPSRHRSIVRRRGGPATAAPVGRPARASTTITWPGIDRGGDGVGPPPAGPTASSASPRFGVT
jgi:hypothetical protein